MREVFERIYNRNEWGGISRSGPGSDPEATVGIGKELRKFIEGRGIYTIVDAPCGEFGWQEAFLDRFIDYCGVDIVPELQFKNLQANRARWNRRFYLADATVDPLPKGELVIVRDLMIHLPLEACRSLLRNLCAHQYRYLAFTHFPEIRGNSDIHVGSFTSRNLMDDPFGFPEPYARLNETRIRNFPQKQLAVYRLEDLKKIWWLW